MTNLSQSQNSAPGGQRFKRLKAPIGLRLSLAFMIIIVLTALIGLLAVQQFSSLTGVTTELNTHDLPEVVILTQVRLLLYQQRDLEQNLINIGVPDVERLPVSHSPNVYLATPTPTPNPSTSTSPSPPRRQITPTPPPDEGPDGFASPAPAQPQYASLSMLVAWSTPTSTPSPTNPASEPQTQAQIQAMLANLQTILKDVAHQRQSLLSFEQPDIAHVRDIPLVVQVSDGLLTISHYSEQIQALVKQNRFLQANDLEVKQQLPLINTTINAVSQLNSVEQSEVSADAAKAQQESSRAIMLVVGLTGLALFLSILLAFIITRSLTKPLSALLKTTETIASGNLDVEPQLARTDEIGRLASGYDKMRLSLRSTIFSLRQERRQTQAIIDASADGVLLMDSERTILEFNPSAERLSGWRSDEAIGRHCWEVFGCRGNTPEETEEHEHVCPLRALSGTDRPYLEMHITARTGQHRWLAVSCAPLPPDESTTEQRMVVGMHDISQLKAVEQMKSDFVAMVSHELRAPLTTVTGSVEMLGMLDPGIDRAAYHEVLHILDQQTRRLRHVVEEVLQVTRLDADRLRLHLQPLSITPFLHTIVDRQSQEWSGSDHYIALREPGSDIQVWADSGLLEIVLRNLFDNARKYTPQGTPVEVEVELLAATSQVQIRIIDHGPGVPPDQIEHIFERFSRGQQSSYHWTRGYGLGLYIARELLLAHNGNIWAENREGGGACFVLSLWAVTDEHRPPVGRADNPPLIVANT